MTPDVYFQCIGLEVSSRRVSNHCTNENISGCTSWTNANIGGEEKKIWIYWVIFLENTIIACHCICWGLIYNLEYPTRLNPIPGKIPTMNGMHPPRCISRMSPILVPTSISTLEMVLLYLLNSDPASWNRSHNSYHFIMEPSQIILFGLCLNISHGV